MALDKVQIVNRLSPDAFAALERQLIQPFVSSETSAHQAGFMLGIQHVLQKLRVGYVIGA